jgi:hypothetical protein
VVEVMNTRPLGLMFIRRASPSLTTEAVIHSPTAWCTFKALRMKAASPASLPGIITATYGMSLAHCGGAKFDNIQGFSNGVLIYYLAC